MKPVSLYSLFAASTFVFAEQPFPQHIDKVEAPPPNIGTITVVAPKHSFHASASVYSIGNPTPEEQLYLELINRARANPTAEAALLASTTDEVILANYRNVDLNLMQTQFNVYSPAQPLAFNAKLISAARRHSQDMFENVFQDHTGSDGSDIASRLEDAGYAGSAGENIYSNARSVEHGHAAFEVDWSDSPANGGMQTPPGHRNSIHEPTFREIGIGVVLGNKAVPGRQPRDHVGPQVVTQDFGVQPGSTPFITGVAYIDWNDNKSYDLTEGLGNVPVTVRSQAAGTAYEGVTALS